MSAGLPDGLQPAGVTSAAAAPNGAVAAFPGAPAGGDVAIEFTSVGKAFPAGRSSTAPVHVLDDINLSVRKNEIVCILGPSGCGKSTLLNCAAGLEAYEGSIRINGELVQEPRPDVAVVFQAPHLLPWRNVLKNTQYGLELRRDIPRSQWPELIKEAVRVVGLSAVMNRYPRQLSGGMQQRVNIARALAVKPEVMLMDEPFGALDALTKERMQEELQRIVAEEQLTVVFITHDIGEAIYLGDRVVVMSTNPGRVRLSYDVTAPRPRSLDFKRSSEFQEIYSTLWEALG